jgi:hypothetical protein
MSHFLSEVETGFKRERDMKVEEELFGGREEKRRWGGNDCDQSTLNTCMKISKQ